MSTVVTASPASLEQNIENLGLNIMKSSKSLELPVWKAPPVTKEEVEWADILTVDLSKYDTHRQELIETVQTALERDGFFYVVGHGISPEKINRQFAIGEIAFDQVLQEEKERHVAPIKQKGTFMGYKLQNYWEIKNGVRDRIEQYNFYQNCIDPVESHPLALQPYIEEVKAFLEVFEKVGNRYSNAFPRLLTTFWVSKKATCGAFMNPMKVLEGTIYMIYDPLTSEEANKTNNVMLSGHTDFNSISCLISQPITALQVLMPDNVWRYVKHHDNAYVNNIGDQLSFMSGGILNGTMHRVVRPPSDQVSLRRIGVYHFAHFIDGVPLGLVDSKKVRKEGRVLFEGKIPTSDEWERGRIKSFGVDEFIKGEEYDIETLNGIQLRHYH